MTAGYFVAELILSPCSGTCRTVSARTGSCRVAHSSGLVAVLTTAFMDLFLWRHALLEGAAAASIPSILGYIALSTSGDQSIRAAPSPASRLRRSPAWAGIVAAGPIFDTFGRGGFILNAGIYIGSFAIYRWGVAELLTGQRRGARAGARRARPTSMDLGRYLRIFRVPRLAAGADLDRAERRARHVDRQSVFQLVREPPPVS